MVLDIGTPLVTHISALGIQWFDMCTNILGKMMVITAPSRRVTWAEYLHTFTTYSLY